MDPFSITASAAGIISLGLTASGGLVRYCKAFQSQNANLAHLTRHSEELESFLKLIENQTATPQSPNGDIDSLLQKCRDACDTCLQDFKRLHAKYARSRLGNNFKDRSRRLVQNLKYPIDKEKFDGFRSQLRELQHAAFKFYADIYRVVMLCET